MSNLTQYVDNIISSKNAPYDTFQRNTPRAASFNLCLSKHALGFALIWAISATSMAFAGEIVTSTNDTMGPLAPVLSTKVIVQGTDNQEQSESFAFEVPEAGEAVLRIVNGAKKGAALSERVQGVELTLNDKVIVNPKSFSDKTDILETRVLVFKGTNRLEIKLLAQADQRVALRIGAPADEIIVAAVNAPVLRSEPLLARATVTGLGLPVPDAQVQFEVRGLGRIIHENATTSNSGVAIAYMREFDAGRGKLHAGSGAKLSHLVAFVVNKDEELTVRQRPESVTLEAGASDRLVLSKPIISPSRIPPGPDKIQVAFGASIAAMSNPPTALVLEQKLSNGKFSQVTTLLKTKAGDGFYSGKLELGSEKATELYFRVSATDYSENTVTSEVAVFPITPLITHPRPSEGDLAITKDRQSQVYTNEVILSTVPGVPQSRVQTIISKIRDSLGLKTIEIVGYIPSIDTYLVEFKWRESFIWHEIFKRQKSLDRLKTVMESFKEYEEIKSVSRNAVVTPAAGTGQWYLDRIGIDKLRDGAAPGSSPAFGSNSIGVGILDTGVDCNSSLLPQPNCVNPPANPLICSEVLENESSTHGTRSAALVAGTPPSMGYVAEGVAWNTKLYPIRYNTIYGLSAAISCAGELRAQGSNIHILNIGGEVIDDSPGNPDLGIPSLRESVCSAVCNNLLLVVSAGNYACRDLPARYPASYDGKLGCPACNKSPAETAERILTVGGVDINLNRGDSCFLKNVKSQVGEIWAPGWGVPAPRGNLSSGTSWSAALVSGCAAVYAGSQLMWDATSAPFIHKSLIDTATLVNNLRILNCSKALGQ